MVYYPFESINHYSEILLSQIRNKHKTNSSKRKLHIRKLISTSSAFAGLKTLFSYSLKVQIVFSKCPSLLHNSVLYTLETY